MKRMTSLWASDVAGGCAPRSKNAFVRAALAEGRQAGCHEDLSDLDDFIVCKGDRDYAALFASDFRYTR